MRHALSLTVLLGAVALSLSILPCTRASEATAANATHAPPEVVHVCATCHGRNGNSINPDVPSLAGQIAPYMERQLAAFKHQGRVGVMGGVAMSLSDADMRTAARYFAQQIPFRDALSSIDPRQHARGAAIYRDGIANKNVPACASCHALQGTGLPPEFPRLAGQHAAYLAAQLRAFRSDDRISNANAMMREVSVKLSDADIDEVAHYIADMR